MKKISICIVEDYFLTRSLYKRILAKDKEFEMVYDFENAEDCIKAFNEIEQNNSDGSSKLPDVVLMDLGLPYMNGIEATRIIKENYPDIKVIILTSHSDDNEVLASLSSGASAFVLKDPDKVLELKSIIKAVNDGILWCDFKIADIARSAIPKPCSTDFNNLYPERRNLLSSLSKRELETLKLLTEGKSNSEIAKILVVTTNTAKAHVSNILLKLNVSDRIQAAIMAIRAKLF